MWCYHYDGTEQPIDSDDYWWRHHIDHILSHTTFNFILHNENTMKLPGTASIDAKYVKKDFCIQLEARVSVLQLIHVSH